MLQASFAFWLSFSWRICLHTLNYLHLYKTFWKKEDVPDFQPGRYGSWPKSLYLPVSLGMCLRVDSLSEETCQLAVGYGRPRQRSKVRLEGIHQLSPTIKTNCALVHVCVHHDKGLILGHRPLSRDSAQTQFVVCDDTAAKPTGLLKQIVILKIDSSVFQFVLLFNKCSQNLVYARLYFSLCI